MSKIRQYDVNWQDGMKINKSHFIQSDIAFHHHIQERAVALMHEDHYGIVPSGLFTSHSYHVLIKDNQCKIDSLYFLHQNGSIVRIDETDNVVLDLTPLLIKTTGSLIYLAAKIEEDKVLLCGNPSGEEQPLRYPNVKPEVIVTTAYGIDNIGFDWFPFARLIRKEHYFELDSEYIAPSTKINALSHLNTKFQSIVNYINDIGKYAIEVASKAKSKKKQGEINDLSESAFYFYEKIAFYLAERFQFLNGIKANRQHPSSLIFFGNGFARTILTALRCLKSENKEYLLRYFESHLGISPHKLEEHLATISQLDYDHLKIYETYNELEKFIVFMRNFISKSRELEFHAVDAPIVETEKKIIVTSKRDIFG